MVRAAYLGTDQPDAMFIRTQATPTPTPTPVEEAAPSEAEEWESLAQQHGLTDWHFPSDDALAEMTDEQAEEFIHQLSQLASTDGQFEAVRDWAQQLGLADPYPPQAGESAMGGPRKKRSRPLPGAMARVRELLGRQGLSSSDIEEILGRRSVRGFYRGRRAFKRLYEAPAERPSDLADIGGVGNWLNYDLYGPESVLRFRPDR